LDRRNRHDDLKGLIKGMAKRLSSETVMVTRGKEGTILYDRKTGFSDCPSFAVKVVDRIGAGDSVLAVTSLCAAAGFPPDLIGFLGNLAGAQAVTIVGNSASISRVSMLKTVESMLK
jgi:sugar/nucleoside kinase (ribokinase family)